MGLGMFGLPGDTRRARNRKAAVLLMLVSASGVVLSLLALVVLGWVSALALFIVSGLTIAVIVTFMIDMNEQQPADPKPHKTPSAKVVLRFFGYGRTH